MDAADAAASPMRVMADLLETLSFSLSDFLFTFFFIPVQFLLLYP